MPSLLFRCKRISGSQGPIRACGLTLTAHSETTSQFYYSSTNDSGAIENNTSIIQVDRLPVEVIVGLTVGDHSGTFKVTAQSAHAEIISEVLEASNIPIAIIEAECAIVDNVTQFHGVPFQGLDTDLWRVIGHRGFGSDKASKGRLQIRENTRSSIEHAFKFGLRAVEVDVQKLADNSLVLYHDELVGFPYANVEVNRLTLGQFKTLVKKYPKGVVIDEEPCLFSEALNLLSRRHGMNVELKMYKSDCCKLSLLQMYEYCMHVYRAVAESTRESVQIVFSSFDLTLCKLMRLIQSDYPVLFVIPSSLENIEGAAAAAKESFLHGLVMTSGQCFLFKGTLRELKRLNSFILFTYDQPSSRDGIVLQYDYGIDGIIIDDPRRYQWLLKSAINDVHWSHA